MTEKTEIGKYKIVEKIGEGGMGKIYKAIHPTLKRHIIIKQLTVHSKAGVNERFKREAEIMIDLRNENIVQVFDFFREGNTYYIAMEYVNGISLEKLIDVKKQICPMATLLIFNEICKGMKYAHDKGIVHRDIKPDNVLISRDGEVKIVDFGIAKDVDDDEDLTKTGAVLGTPSYMSPEQLSSARKVDKRSDIYSLGVLFYKMITGTRPFAGNFTVETINDIVKGNYVRPEKLNPDIPGLFRQIIRKTMNSRIAKRYKDLKYLIHLIAQYTHKFKDQHAVETAIKGYVLEKDNTHSVLGAMPVKKKKHIVLKLIIGLLLISGIGLSALFVYTRGYYLEFLGTRTHGALEIRLAIPVQYPKPPNTIYAFAEIGLVSADGKDKKQLVLSRPMLDFLNALPWASKQKKQVVFLTTDALYLASGSYHLTVYAEDRVYVREFFLYPRDIQKQSADTAFVEHLDFSLVDPLPSPIEIMSRITDGRSGKEITDRVKTTVKIANKWLDWDKDKDAIAPVLLSGRAFTLKYEAEGYYSRTVNFTVPETGESVVVDLELTGVPVKVTIDCDTAGLEILFNDKAEDYLGGNDRKYVQFGVTAKGQREFLLAPGRNTLTLKKDAAKKTLPFDAAGAHAVVLKAGYDGNTKVIRIEEATNQK